MTSADDIEGQVRSFRAGDQAAAEQLAWRACRLALRTAAAVLGSREDAADLAQDVAVDVLRSLDRLREPRAFDAWVHRALATSLAELPPRQRVALALRYVHDLSEAQIAEVLECRPGAAASLLSRGRAALRRHPGLADLAPLATSGGDS